MEQTDNQRRAGSYVSEAIRSAVAFGFFMLSGLLSFTTAIKSTPETLPDLVGVLMMAVAAFALFTVAGLVLLLHVQLFYQSKQK